MKKVLGLLIGMLLSGTLLKGQSSLGIDTTWYYYSDTTCFGNNDLYMINVKNYGPQPYTGEITIDYAVDSTTIGNSFTLLTSDSFPGINISTLGSVPDSNYISITPAFRSGINTVVIWPRSTTTNFTTHDSLYIPVWVPCLMGISDIEIKLNTKIFPNPVQQYLFIANTDKNFMVEQVRIFSCEGKLLNDEPFSGKINLSGLSPGIYFIELSNSRGQTSRHKIIKE